MLHWSSKLGFSSGREDALMLSMLDELPSEFPLRSGLLPSGCRNLLDVIEMAETARWEAGKAVGEALIQEAAQMAGKVVPVRVIEVGANISVRELAEHAGYEPFQFIKVLICMEVFVANVDKAIPFAMAAEIGQRLGFEVRRLG